MKPNNSLKITASNDLLSLQLRSTRLRFERVVKSLNPIAYYPLTENSGDAINHAPATFGTLNGTVTGATQAAQGKFGKAYSFDGTNDVVDLGNDSQLVAGTTDFSFGQIVYVPSDASNFSLASRNGASANGYDILLANGNTPGRLVVRVDSDSSAMVTSPQVIVETDNWYFIVGVLNRTAGTIEIFVNGVSGGTSDISALGDITNAQNPKIGLRGGNYGKFTAQHTFFVRRAITQAEITRLSRIAGL